MSFTDVFKKIFGTKAERDLKQLQPVLQKVLAAYPEIDSLSDDQLREKSAELRRIIRERIAGDEERIAQIKEELEKDIPLDQKEALATESDKLVKKVDEDIEKVLDEILPIAFAVMKSTARRFKENETIRVKATEFDRILSTTKDFVEIDGDYAVWHNHWMAGGNEITWERLLSRLFLYSLMHWQVREYMSLQSMTTFRNEIPSGWARSTCSTDFQ